MVNSYKGEMTLVLIMSCLISFQMAQEKQRYTETTRTWSQHWRAPGTRKSLMNGAVSFSTSSVVVAWLMESWLLEGLCGGLWTLGPGEGCCEVLQSTAFGQNFVSYTGGWLGLTPSGFP